MVTNEHDGITPKQWSVLWNIVHLMEWADIYCNKQSSQWWFVVTEWSSQSGARWVILSNCSFSPIQWLQQKYEILHSNTRIICGISLRAQAAGNRYRWRPIIRGGGSLIVVCHYHQSTTSWTSKVINYTAFVIQGKNCFSTNNDKWNKIYCIFICPKPDQTK